jgi:hypothetical protein
MFPDSAIARNFTCGRDKAAYLAQFGLAPYFTKTLKETVGNGKEFCVMFDESLNNVTGDKQMDVHLRFWHDGAVCSRYLTSEFLGHSTAADMVQHMKVRIKRSLF